MAPIDASNCPLILRLPPILHREVAKYLPDSDINVLAQTSRYFCSVMNPILWDFDQRNENNPPNAMARDAAEVMVYASKNGNMFALEKLFRVTDVHPNARNSAGELAICVAAKQNYGAIVYFLINQRALLPNGLNPNERPLTHAVTSSWTLMVRFLLMALPGPVDLHDALNFVASQAFARSRQRNAIIREFAFRFPPIAIYPLYFKCQAARMIVRIGSINLMRSYLHRGGLVNVRDHRHNTLVHTAVKLGNLDMVELLLSRGAIADTRNIDRKTPLDEAIENQDWDIARLLPDGQATFEFYSEVGFI